MYLSQLMFNPRSRLARRDLADRYELHRTLLAAFPTHLPEDERVLYRVEDMRPAPVVPVLVQSNTLPEWETAERMDEAGYLTQEPRVRPINPAIETDQVMHFRLQANPTVKRDGKRHALYADDDLLAWLERKANQHGFAVDLNGVQMVKLGNRYGKKRRQTWHAVQFDGLLEIRDPAAFRETLAGGIGSAKAFGFGLLSIPYPSA